MKKFFSLIIITFLTMNSAQALFGSSKTDLEKEIEARAKIEEKKLKKAAKEEKKRLKKLEKQRKKLDKLEKRNKVNESLTNQGQEISGESRGELINEQIIRVEEDFKESKSEKARTKSGSKRKKNKKDKEIEELRRELKENEKKALDFVFPSIESDQELESANFFSQGEKEQLLELWRATLARNRTIQFIIKSLSSNPNEIEKNNAVMQVLSKALFVPFYAVSSVANNSLISGGSAVGARVIGDVVNSSKEKKDQARQITRTDLIVLFMLVDEVAQRMRESYYSYKTARIEKELLSYELKTARLDWDEAMNKTNSSSQASYFTGMIVKDLERRRRQNKLDFLTSRRTLVELAGLEAVESVDLLIDMEVQEISSDILGV